MDAIKAAIPVFNSMVSHRCDCAGEFLIVSIENGAVREKETLPVSGMNEIQIMKALMRRGVAVIVGGAMTGFCHRLAESMGMQVFHVSEASVDDAIRMLQTGETPSSACWGRQWHGSHMGRGCRRRLPDGGRE